MASFIAKMLGLSPAKPTPKEAPDPTTVTEDEYKDLERFRKKRKGRSDTILTGDLVPPDTGKKTLLG